jgi:hypothetical protein
MRAQLPSPSRMNQLIPYDEAAGFLKNPPSVIPRPNFAKIWALQKHITHALKQLDCPQSLIYGWAGLVMDPTIYALIQLSPFTAPPIRATFPSTQILHCHRCSNLWSNCRTTR